MADNFIQVAADGVGKKMQTYLNTISASDVHAEAVVIVDAAGSPLGPATEITLAEVKDGVNNLTYAQGGNPVGALGVLVQTTAKTNAPSYNDGTLNPLSQDTSGNLRVAGSVSGSVTANAGTNLNTSLLATSTNLTAGTQKTQVVDGTNASNVAGVTAGALNVYLPNITANAGTNLNTSLLSTSAKQTDGSQKAQICDPINVSNVAGVTSGGLNVYLPSITANAGTSLNTALLATSANLTAGTQKTQICDPINVSNIAGVTSGGLNVYLPSITANSGTNLNTGNIAVKIFQGGAFLASGQITIGNISTTIAGARATRRSATIRNQDTANSGYIGPAPIGTGNGLLLFPGDSVSVDFTGVIAGISLNTTNAGNVTFGYLETYD